jgi:hypothetical protein
VSGIVSRNTVYSDTPGRGVTNDLDDFRAQINPEEISKAVNGWQQLKIDHEADFNDKISELMKTNPGLANTILKQTMDIQLNQFRARTKRPVSM